jgi:chromosome segregation ATPase
MTPVEEKDMRELIGELEQKLNATIAAGLSAVNLAIAQLTEAHHKSLLEQERRNSQFASRDRVDDVARRLDRTETQLADRSDRLGKIEQAIDNLARTIASLESKTSSQSLRLLGSASGYLVILIINMSSVLITYLLTRGH